MWKLNNYTWRKSKKIREENKRKRDGKFDYDKIKDMEYDSNRGCYVGKNREEFHVTPYSNEIAYNRYKNSVLVIEEQFISCELQNNNSKILKRIK